MTSTSSDYIGVGWNKKNNSWLYRVKLDNGKTKTKSKFSSDEHAAIQRDYFIIKNNLTAERNFTDAQLKEHRAEGSAKLFGKK
ncbi:hypothetical protein KAR91_19780 [Candidatus Pacearchaeota archaeon]|nr:hypothetical protein [Candidatus Pacearchaeota archaeon]